jgi:LacI family transcriptional regulator
MRKVTIVDIAKKLNTNPSTVSRALAGNTRVSKKTRELVSKTAKEMGYTPNILASSLRKGRHKTIGMIVPRIDRHFFSNVISGVEEVLNPKSYSLLICQTNEDYDTEVKAVDTLTKNQVSGIILSLSVETDNFEHLEYVNKANIPLVQFDRINNDLMGAKIKNDNFNGAYQATSELINNGYQKIAHLAGSLHLNAYLERHEGYKKALEDNGIRYNSDLVFENAITRDAGKNVVKEHYDQLKFDACFCAGDFSALGVIESATEKKLKVGKDFGVVGFANEPFAELMYPKLSSIEQNSKQMGRESAKAILELIENPEKEMDEININVEYVSRESSKK